MALLTWSSFAGELPALNAHKLPPHNAQVARNVKLWTGAIEPMRGIGLVRSATTAGTPKTLFKYDKDTWLEFSGKVSVVRSPVPNDQYKRVYIFDGEFPKVTDQTRVTAGTAPYPGATLRAGVPAPTTAPVAALGGATGDADELAETVFYVVTFENEYGEEGPPSLVSNEGNYRPGQYHDLALPPIPLGPYEIVTKNIYRSAGGSAFQWIAEVGPQETTHRDTYGDPAFEELETTDWAPPPAELEGAIMLAGGFIAAYRENELWFSEPGLPHAWPHSYPVDHKILGLGGIGNNVVVVTEGQLYIFTGVHPGSMAPIKPEVGHGCVSADSIVDMGYGVMYAAADGLVWVGPEGTPVLLTERMWVYDQFKALRPETIRGALWKQMYLAFYNDGEGEKAFLVNPRQAEAGIAQMPGVLDLGARYTDPHDGNLYLALSGNIGEWDAGVLGEYVWRTRPSDLTRPLKIKALQVLADSYPATLALYADGKLQARVEVEDERPVRIPCTRYARSYELEVTGQSVVYGVLAATTIEELRHAG